MVQQRLPCPSTRPTSGVPKQAFAASLIHCQIHRDGKRNPNLRAEVVQRHVLRVVQDKLAHTGQH